MYFSTVALPSSFASRSLGGLNNQAEATNTLAVGSPNTLDARSMLRVDDADPGVGLVPLVPEPRVLLSDTIELIDKCGKPRLERGAVGAGGLRGFLIVGDRLRGKERCPR